MQVRRLSLLSVEKIVYDIKETEAVAAQKISEATAAAKAKVAQAQAQAEAMIEELNERKAGEIRAAVAGVQDATQKEIAAAKEQNQQKCKETKATAAEQMETAVRLVTERIVSSNGHS